MRYFSFVISLILFVFSASYVSAASTASPVGGDVDAHGCKPSAGYSWNAQAQKCIRAWESSVRVINVWPKTADCVWVAPMKCMQVRQGARWQNFYGSISGFEYVPGYNYRLQVLVTKASNPPADWSSLSYELLKVVSKKPTAETLANNPLIGDWKLVSYNGKDVVGKYTAAFEADHVSLRFCNIMSGAFKLTGNTFSSSSFISTEMYCEGEPMVLEGNFDLNGATYAIKSTRSIPPVHILTITTKKGNTYTFKR